MKYITLDRQDFFKAGIPFYMDRQDYMDYGAIKYHCHDFIEIAYVYSGKGKHVINGQECPVSRGDLFVINMDVPHSFYPLDTENSARLSVINCIFMPEFINGIDIELPILREISGILLYKSLYSEEIGLNADICFTAEACTEMERICIRMLSEYQFQKEGHIEILKLLLCELLVTVYRAFKERKTGSDKCRNAKYAFLKDAINYLEENYSRKLSIGEISRKAFMSKSYFSSMFREATGMSIIEYLQRLRVENACRYLLEAPWETITEIAYKMGYEDSKFFNKVFKRITGLSAVEYRKKYHL